jgi:hypothetical protein
MYKTSQSKHSPNGPKFAHSGHPGRLKVLYPDQLHALLTSTSSSVWAKGQLLSVDRYQGEQIGRFFDY